MHPGEETIVRVVPLWDKFQWVEVHELAQGFFWRFFGNSYQLELAVFEFLDFDLSFFSEFGLSFEFFTKIPLRFCSGLCLDQSFHEICKELDGSASHCKSLEIFDICFVI